MSQRTGNISSYLNSEAIRKKIDEYLPRFIDACLKSDCEIIVPIVSEGLAIFIPKLLTERELINKIVPSNRFLLMDPSDWVHKKILVVDAAAFSGETLLAFLEEIKKCSDQYNSRKVKKTALLVREELKVKNLFTGEIPKPLFLSGRQYEWARDYLSEYIFLSVGTRTDDLPLWEVDCDPSDKYEIPMVLQRIPGIYQSFYNFAQCSRFSFCDISLVDNSWLPPYVMGGGIIKIRVFMNNENNSLQILPLFLPTIKYQNGFSVNDVIAAAQRHLGEIIDLTHLQNLALDEERHLGPVDKYRWVCVLGSLLLLRDFANKLRDVGRPVDFDWGSARLSKESKLLLKMENNKKLGTCIEQIVRQSCVEQRYSKGNQIFFNMPLFSFGPDNYEFDRIMGSVSPEEELLAILGSTIEPSTPDRDHLEISWTFSEIIGRSSKSLVLRAVDDLIDEGILKPFTIVQGDTIQRALSPGGEDALQRLITSGEIFNCLYQKNE
jgi:hypothetical protein